MHKMNTLLFILIISTISLSLSQRSRSPPPVRDIDGKLLRSTTAYYILPVFRGRGGGLTLAALRNKACPLDVVQENMDLNKGMPLTLRPFNPKKGTIRESTDLNIKFSTALSVCIQSNVWMVEDFEGERIVSSHGVEGNPGQESISSWFKIEKYEEDYKLVFCPTVCDSCKPLCGDIGIKFGENGTRRLAIANVPFQIEFKKVK